ncbi:WD40/YVTN/BNR-like repeat-containing protein [Coraliomargarita sp. W4R72]
MSIFSHSLRFKSVAFAATLLVVGAQALSAVGTIADSYKAVTWSGSNLVALDFNSDLYTSADDGASFTLRGTTTESFEDVSGLGSTAIAVGIDALILRSANDGVTWSSAVSPVLNGSLLAVAGRSDGVNPNQWLAVGDDGFDGYVYRSQDDGAVWTQSASFGFELLAGVTWTGSQWLVCGRDDFSNTGLVKYSADGVTWTASSVPSDSQPLLAMASDGAGDILAVGELGEVLRSTDGGLNFTRISSPFNGSGDLRAVVVDSSGDFYVGGDEKLILKVIGSSISTVVPATSDAAPVLDLVLINDQAVAVGSFFAADTRTLPFAVTIATGGGEDLVLTVAESLLGKSYYVETTTDLTQVEDSWAVVSGSSVLGTGGALTFDVSEDEAQRFWRVVEF